MTDTQATQTDEKKNRLFYSIWDVLQNPDLLLPTDDAFEEPAIFSILESWGASNAASLAAVKPSQVLELCSHYKPVGSNTISCAVKELCEMNAFLINDLK